MARKLELGSAFGGAAAAATSMAASLCCVGPLALTLLGVNGMILAAGIKPYRGYLLGASLVLLGLAFWVTYRRRRGVREGDACQLPSGRVAKGRVTRIILWASAALWIGALILNLVSDRLYASVGAVPDDMVTPDYVSLDVRGEPLKSAFNADADKVRLLMLVAPT